MRIADKKRFTLSCIFFTLILILLSNIVFIANKSRQESKPAQSGSITLAAEKTVGIAVEENEFYKKYIISLKSAKESVNSENGTNYIEIVLNKDDVEQLSDHEDKEWSIKQEGDKYLLKFKKMFDNNNEVYIDNKKVEILISKLEKPYKYKVVIDPGHGGADKGANIGSMYEKDIALKIAKYIPENLIYEGYNTILTRDSDKLLDFKKEIPNIANSAEADIFISVHVNWNKESKYNGITTYYYNPNNYQTNERMNLAKIIQKNLVSKDGWQDRGIAKQNLSVLRGSKIPCVLIEVGFLSNNEDRERLSNDEILKNAAQNISKGIEEYLKQ